jgi:acyl-CoA synthetase (AMP-forming)/AMP-acid ligase II
MVHRPAPDDLAFLQFSSGSTGTPKGVELTHANVVANVDQARRAGSATPSDVMVSWLPYFHDMGLIGAHLAPLSVRIKQVKLDPIDFGKRPALWYETAARHRATLMPMASFALALTLKRVPSEQVARWDLSPVRLVGVGAEPISVRTWQRYLDHLRPARLAPSALVPAYGLAEATLAVALPPTGEVARPLVLDAGHWLTAAPWTRMPISPLPSSWTSATPSPVASSASSVATARSSGTPRRADRVQGSQRRSRLPPASGRDGHHLRRRLAAHRRSRVLARPAPVRHRPLQGRHVRNGQKYHAHDLEQSSVSTPGVPSGRVAVVGCTHPATGAERVVVFVPSTASWPR